MNGRILCSLVVALSAAAAGAFQTRSPTGRGASSPSHSPASTRLYSDSDDARGRNGKTRFGQKTDADVSRFLTDFRTADGKVVDPYRMLELDRGATSMEIKQSYYRLSRKLHPDRVAQMDILPGKW